MVAIMNRWAWARLGSRLSCSLALSLLVLYTPAAAHTGTFIDRHLPTDLRVVSYNVLWDSVFPDRNAVQAAKFERVIDALNPDILTVQEIGDPFSGLTPKTGEDFRILLNTIAPLPDGASWHTHKGSDAVTASKYPLTLTRTNTSPVGDKTRSIALVNLPDAQFASDFYFINEHYKCCGGVGSSEDARRQKQSDSNVNWLRDARTPGGSVTLAPGTPFAIVGDLNIVGGPQPLQTLIDGNIIDEATFGPDSPPDWDGTNLTDLHPYHNIVGPADYTWREDGSGFAPGRLDYIIYSDSALDVANSFILNTVTMSSAQLAATGLQQFDITKDFVGTYYDHLPLVADFRLHTFATADFNFSRTVNGADLAVWEDHYSKTGMGRSNGDTDGDGDVDGRDFLVWQRQYTPTQLVAVPEPSSLALLLCCLACGPRSRWSTLFSSRRSRTSAQVPQPILAE